MQDKVQRLLCIVKEHNISIAPQNVEAKPPVKLIIYCTITTSLYLVYRQYTHSTLNVSTTVEKKVAVALYHTLYSIPSVSFGFPLSVWS